jgi:AcrR family transcriptional regulator
VPPKKAPKKPRPRWPQIWAEERLSPRPTLSRDTVVAAAIALADHEGLDAVSIRRLGAELGIRPMSLYRYVPSKGDLLELISDAVLGEEPLPTGPSDDWRADLRHVAHLHRAVALRHPWCIRLTIGRPPVGPNAMRINEFTMATMDRFGLDIHTINALVDTVNAYVAGTLADDLAESGNLRTEVTDGASWQKTVEPWIDKLQERGEHPMTVRFLRDPEYWDDDRGFDFGLETVLTGIAARLPKERPADRSTG